MTRSLRRSAPVLVWCACWLTVHATSAQPQSAAPPLVLDSTWLAAGAPLPTTWWLAGPSGPHLADTRLAPGTVPEGWQGDGSFSLPVRATPALVDRPLALSLRHFGPVTVTLDGQPVRLDADMSRATARAAAHASIVLPDTSVHTLGVRLRTPDRTALRAVGYPAGFTAMLGPADAIHGAWTTTVARAARLQWGLPTAYTIFGVLHLLLFLFYPRLRENLYFAVVCFCISAVVYFNYQEAFFYDSAEELVLIRRLWSPLTVVTVLALLRFVYAVYRDGLPRHFWGFVAVGMGLGVYGWFAPRLGWWPVGGRTYAYAFVLVLNLDMLRVAGTALLQRGQGPVTVALGVLAFVVAFSYPLCVVLGLLPFIDIIDTLAFSFYVVLGLLFAISVYLSRRFAQTSRDLEQRVAEVEQLSAQKLEQERRAQQEEVERLKLEAAYQQKVQELEEARQLQLSLLPRTLPDLPRYDVAAFMETAAEVGGDYYDFAADDGTLTVAVGDATGHGLKAGTMVTATKSLFNAFRTAPDLLDVVQQSTWALKRMNWHRLYMALTLARFHDGRLRLTTAGMPPTLIWRAGEQQVETVTIKGMPLGSFPSFPYREEEHALHPGDAVLFMSDGFPELFNGGGEMLGYQAAADAFGEVAAQSQTAHEVVEGLVRRLRAWSGERALDDDVTFVVIRHRHPT